MSAKYIEIVELLKKPVDISNPYPQDPISVMNREISDSLHNLKILIPSNLHDKCVDYCFAFGSYGVSKEDYTKQLKCRLEVLKMLAHSGMPALCLKLSEEEFENINYSTIGVLIKAVRMVVRNDTI